MTKNRRKLTCSKFFEKFKNCFFFWIFRRRCLKKSSEGTKNNQKKISSSFREICEFMFKKSKKNQPPILAKIFEKSNFFLIFWVFCKKYLETHFKSIRTSLKKISSSFRDMGQKKKVARPSIHPIPSVNTSWRGRLVPRCGRKSMTYQ